MRGKTEKSENRQALPKFFLTMLGSLLAGGLLGFAVGLSRFFEMGEIAGRLDGAVRAATPWGIPVTTAVILGTCWFLYRSAAKKAAAWDGGDEDDASEAAETLLSWTLLLSAVQLLINLFFMTAIGTYQLADAGTLGMIGVFLLSCGLVIFTQQKVVDLERRMNPEKHGSVYDTKFQKKWLASCDESERRQIGEASRQAYLVTTRVCLGIWLVLTVLGMVYDIGMLPVFVVLVVWGTLQVSYTVTCIRLSKKGAAAGQL